MEILSPAGGMESVIAAVQNGADAVYLGAGALHARQRAQNFTEETLKEAVDYCHLRGVRVYQTVNTLVDDRAWEELQKTLSLACRLGVDALIVQDLGVAQTAKACCPQVPLHGSTQMTVHSPAGARFCKELGISRVVLARELTLKEIAEIIDTVDIEVEVFGHGALCMSVSGQCYLSQMIGGRSGNRGSCAGTCRLPFGTEHPEQHDLSLKDLATVSQFETLQQMGVACLKIEGRMKRPEYVAAATAAYAGLNEARVPSLDTLQAVFSRTGFTDGYLTGKRDGEMFGMRGKEDVQAATSPLLSSLRQTYHKEGRKVAVSAVVVATAESLTLTLSDGAHTVCVEGNTPMIAKTRATTAEEVTVAMEKLGGTPFACTDCAVSLSDGLMIPKSVLNDLRRQAVEALSTARIAGREIPFSPLSPKTQAKVTPSFTGKVARLEQVSQWGDTPWDLVVLPLSEVIAHQSTLDPERVVVAPNRLGFGDEAETIAHLRAVHKAGFTCLAASTVAHLQLAKELGFSVFAQPFLNCTNTRAAAVMEAFGATHLVPSFDLSNAGAKRLQATAAIGTTVYGKLPAMVVRNCPLGRHRHCGKCKGAGTLTDRLGNRFAVRCRDRKFAEVHNCKTLWLADKSERVVGFSYYYFTDETVAEVRQVFEDYKRGTAPQGAFTRGN